MGNEKVNSKMYLEIVSELRQLIKSEEITTGGKLPSERELAERMQVGRSTIREALRSLELLGLIETRRGEGTFLADFQNNQFVEVVAEFIMQQPTSMFNVQQTREMHEIAALELICKNETLRSLPVWVELRNRLEHRENLQREVIIREMIVATGNRLSLKIWYLLKQYSRVPFSETITDAEKTFVDDLLSGMLIGDNLKARQAHSSWIALIEGERGEEIDDSRNIQKESKAK